MNIRSKEDAVQHLLDLFSNKEKDFRVMNAISGAALGGAIGGMGAAVINRNKRDSGALKYGGIGALLGGVGGYLKKPRTTEKQAHKEAIGWIKALGGAYTVTDSATGKPEVEEHDTRDEAEEKAKYLSSQGRKTFVVTPDDYELPLQL